MEGGEMLEAQKTWAVKTITHCVRERLYENTKVKNEVKSKEGQPTSRTRGIKHICEGGKYDGWRGGDGAKHKWTRHRDNCTFTHHANKMCDVATKWRNHHTPPG
jgi:hypothetical protein